MNQTIISESQNAINREKKLFFVTPAADIWHDRESYTLELEMPGVGKEGVEVSVEDGKLMVVGRRQEENDYRRVFDLSPEVDASGVQAKLEQGLLILRMPKSGNMKPRKIIVE